MGRLYEDALPVSRDAQRIVREMLVQPRGIVVNAAGEHAFAAPWPADTVLSAKTGSGSAPSGKEIRWIVGSHVQRAERSWVFVACVTGSKSLAASAAMDLAAEALRHEKVL